MAIISIDTEKPSDIDMLTQLLAVINRGPVAKALDEGFDNAKKAAAPAKKAAAAPKVTSPEPVEVPGPEPTASGEPTLDDAIALATQLVADGRAAEVKPVLADLGVERVSKLTGNDIAAFISSFS